MKVDIVEAFAEIARVKSVEKQVLAEILENIFLSMIKKKYGTTDNFDIFVNMDEGDIEIYHSKTIVEEVEDELTEISIDRAKKLEPDLEVGDEYLEIINPASFGRRLIISAKQNMSQKIKDIEKENIYEEYLNRKGEIVVGDIRQVNREEIYLNVDKVEVILPKKEQIPTERYHRGDTLRAVIKDVIKTARGPEIIASRADPSFILRLFELEVPEIYDGIIEVKAIAREPGERTKIAVYSNDKRIDAIGACVGLKGMRIQSVVKELNNEKIDIINWSSEPEIFISRALSPAKPIRIALEEQERKVIAVFEDDQISLAIGRGGQNRRLASKLTSYDVQTVRESEYQKIMKAERGKDLPLSEAKGLTPSMLKKLIAGGFETIRDVLEVDINQLTSVKGIGPSIAKKIREKLGG